MTPPPLSVPAAHATVVGFREPLRGIARSAILKEVAG